MKEINVAGKKRTDTGKKATKELRKQGYVPCNLYGEKKDANGNPEALAFAILATDLRKVVYTPHIYVVNLDIDGEKHTAVMRELQFHPVTDALLHIDFYEINEKKPITIGIPVKLNGLAQGVRDGGKINLAERKLNVTAPYKQIPEVLDIDVTNLQLGKSIKVGELSFEGLEIATPAQVIVCSVKATRASRSAAAAAEAEAAAE
jgi:large subunit ribosomal protein L25